MNPQRLLWLFALCGVVAFGQRPVVVGSSPEPGARDVDPTTRVLRVEFDQEMDRGQWTLWRSERGALPPLAGDDAVSWIDARRVEIRLGALAPATTYALQLNAEARGRQGFRSAAGATLADTVLVFTTAGASAPPAPAQEPPAPAPSPPTNPPLVPPAASGATARLPIVLDFGDPRPDPDRKWTILFFVDGDNNLERHALADLNALEATLPEKGVEVIALVDRARGFDDGDGDWADTRAYRMRPGRDPDVIESEILARPGEIDTGDPRWLASLVAAGAKSYPAPKLALFMWNHGDGWVGQVFDEDAPGAVDGRNHLDLEEFTSALESGLAAAGRQRVDLVLMDECLMGQLEVAAALAPFADVLVASEALVPGSGTPEGVVVPLFAADPTAAEAGEKIVLAFRAEYEGRKIHRATLTALDLRRIGAVEEALGALAEKLGPSAENGWPMMSRSFFFAESYLGRADFRRGINAKASVDLFDLVTRLRSRVQPFPAEGEWQRLVDAGGEAVIAHYAGRERKLSRGISIYAPLRGDMVRDAYRKLGAGRQARWLEYVDRVHAAQRAKLAPPRIVDVKVVDHRGQEVDTVSSLGGVAMAATVEGSNILWVTASQVRRHENPAGYAVLFRTFVADPSYERRRTEAAAELADLVMPEYPDGRFVVRSEVGGLIFKVTNGRVTADATIDYSDPNDLRHAVVPAIYSHPEDGRFRVDILFNVNWSRADQVIGYLELPGGGVVPRPIEPKRDAEITLGLEIVQEGGKTAMAASETMRWEDGLSLVPVFQEPGRYGMLVQAESIAGVSDAEVFGYTQGRGQDLQGLIDAGARYRAADLVGSWEWQEGTMPEGASGLSWKATGARVVFTATSELPALLGCRVEKEGTAVFEGVTLVDVRGAPCLVWFTRDERGEWQRSDMQVAFLLRDPASGQAALVAKDLFRGAVYRLLRTTPGAPGPGPSTPPTPDPGPAGTLLGRWLSDDGSILVIGNGVYQVFAQGVLVEQGRYRVSGSTITATTHLGETVEYGFTLEGDALTLRQTATGLVRAHRRIGR